MASIWKGTISFGLVTIPVELRSAVRSDHIKFRMLHEEDHAPIKYERVCERDGEPVPWAEIVKGYEYEKGKFVVVTDKDFETAALEASKSFEILDFVNQDEIDPRYFDTPYYLTPASGGEKPYAVLREAIRESNSVGIGKIIIHQKQHLAGIKAVGDALMLEMMRFSNEIVPASDYSFPESKAVRPQERKMATQLVSTLTEKFDPKKYTDEYRANLMRVINSKMKGKKLKLVEPKGARKDPEVIDLMSRLQASLKQGRGGKKKTAARKSSTSTRRPARAHTRANARAHTRHRKSA